MSETKKTENAKTQAQTPRTPGQQAADTHKGPWVLMKNGNYMGLAKDKAGAISGLKTLSGVESPPAERTDGSIMLSGVGHYRTKPVDITY